MDLVSIKDVRIPREMQRAMAAEAEADREAKAKVSGRQMTVAIGGHSACECTPFVLTLNV